MKIAISAGHNTTDPGAVKGTMIEHEHAVYWQWLVADFLARRGAIVKKIKVGLLNNKIKEINAALPKYDLAIEMHFNSDANSRGTGSEILYYPGNKAAAALATTILRATSSFCSPNRGAKEGWYKMIPGGTVDAFLRDTNCKALILEPYFIHEGARIQTNALVVCEVIANAIYDTLK